MRGGEKCRDSVNDAEHSDKGGDSEDELCGGRKYSRGEDGSKSSIKEWKEMLYTKGGSRYNIVKKYNKQRFDGISSVVEIIWSHNV